MEAISRVKHRLRYLTHGMIVFLMRKASDVQVATHMANEVVVVDRSRLPRCARCCSAPLFTAWSCPAMRACDNVHAATEVTIISPSVTGMF